MRKYGLIPVVPFLLLVLSSAGAASDLDGYYLERFATVYGGPEASATAASVKSSTVSSSPAERCMTPLHHAVRRDWKFLSRETQDSLAKYLAAPVLQGSASFASPGGHFMIHYATSGVDVPPLTDADADGVPDWVETVASTFEEVYATETVSMGYRPAPPGEGGRYHVYLKELSTDRQFGRTDSDVAVAPGSTSFTSFIIIDDDFSEGLYAPFTAEKGLRVTAAHEYHHAIQYGYNFFFDIWYAEATSAWMEDEVYDDINQLYNYLPPYFQNSTLALNADTSVTTGGGYGRWIMNRFLAEKYSSAVIKSFWENLATIPAPPSGADIPMTPVLGNVIAGTYGGNFGADFLAFAKRVYTQTWSSHAGDIGRIHPAVPAAGYSSYPVNAGSTPVPAVTLAPYSFAFYRFVPVSAAPFELKLTIARAQGVSVVAFKKATLGVTEFPLDPETSTITIPDFNSLATSEVMLLFCNNSPLESQIAGFTTDGTVPPQAPSVSEAAPSPSSDGGGCFIATAAYGSYLDPKVMVLRHFRDRFLLTNAPGRAFVDLYYTVSPPVARFIARHETLRALCRIALTPLVFLVEYTWLVPVFFVAGFALLAGREKAGKRSGEEESLQKSFAL